MESNRKITMYVPFPMFSCYPRELTGYQGPLTQKNNGVTFDPSVASRSWGHPEVGNRGLLRELMPEQSRRLCG